jgi:sigma-B regulation protein RsbU (phosphoserine phosphatase)
MATAPKTAADTARQQDAGPSLTGLVRRIQQSLATVGSLQGISVHVANRHGVIVSVLEDGIFAPAGSAAWVGSINPGRAEFSFPLDDGGQIVVYTSHENSETARLVGVVLQGSLQAMEAEKREELLLEELGANWESLEALYEISTDVLRSGDIQDALRRLIHRLAAIQSGLHCVLFIRRENVFHPLVSTERGVSSLTWEELGLAGRAIREMRVELRNQIVDSGEESAPWRRAGSVAAAPFSWQGCVGFVAVWSDDPNRQFDASFSRLLEAITYQVAVMMEGDRLHRKVRESELLAQEVEIASSIQQTLLLANAPTGVPAFEVASCSLPSQRIDGDFHDFFQHPNGSLDVLVGDVMGKGVAAALLGAAAKSQILRAMANLALATQETPRPAQIVARAASRLSDRLISLDRFVTLCYARFDAAGQTVTFVDCGHTSMIVESKGRGTCEFLPGRDLPLGVLPDYQCEDRSVAFRPGETFLLYSDGVTENSSPEGELFGTERLADCVQNWSALGPELLVAQIRKEALLFRGSEKLADDFTCIAVRIRMNPAASLPIVSGSATFPCDAAALGGLRKWLRDCVQSVDDCLGEDDLARLEITCDEVLANCAEHAADDDGHATPVQVEIRVFQDHAMVEFRHRGPAFDPLSVPSPLFDGSREGGFGIYIVLRSTDDVHFGREPDGTNVTTLTFLKSGAEREP